MAADKKNKGTKKSKPKGNATGTRKKASDPRFRIISGVFLMLVSLFIIISTISYLIGYNLTGNWGETIGEWCCIHVGNNVGWMQLSHLERI